MLSLEMLKILLAIFIIALMQIAARLYIIYKSPIQSEASYFGSKPEKITIFLSGKAYKALIRETLIKDVIQAACQVKKEGLNLSFSDIEAHHLAGGNILDLVEAVTLAKKHRINVEFIELSTFDLGGLGAKEAVEFAIKEGCQISNDEYFAREFA